MWHSETKLDKYLYVRTNPYLVRILGLLGLITTFVMAYGFWRFFHSNALYFLIFGVIGLIFIINKVMRYFIQIFYPKFDISHHEQFVNNFWLNNPEPPVDIFLPWAGEDLDMHEQVLKAVKNIDYKNYQVYMLDDKGNDDHKKLAERYGFVYLSRPNKGEFKKSGNLQYGYDHSSGEFIFILDADFIPTRDSLKDLIPYIASDSEMGILQTPQYLEQTDQVHARSRIEFGGGNIVEEFYKINMPCRDVFRAAMCVGTSAVYRRNAILKLEGTPKVHASEDLATGLLITQHGYYVKYLPLVCSIGKSPEDYQGYFKQHHRWCSGNIVFAKYWPNARLSVMGRLIYLSNPFYYLSEAFSTIFSFHFLLLLYFNFQSLAIANVVYFLPYIIYSRLVVPQTKTHKNKLGTRLAALSNSYTYIYTYIHLLTKGAPQWHPTGAKTQKLHNDFQTAINIGILISTSFVVLFVYVLFAKPEVLGNYNTYLILIWSFYSAFWHAVFLYAVSRYILKNKLSQVNHISSKVYLYTKTHFTPLLLSILAISIAYNGYQALKNPASPTVLAFNNITHSTQLVQPQIAQVFTTPAAQVLGQSTPNQDTQIKVDIDSQKPYTYQVQSGDTLIKLSSLAISDYVEQNSVTLSQSQLNKAANKLVSLSQYSPSLHPGQNISFDSKDVQKALDLVF